MTGINLLIYELTTIIKFPLTSTATHFALLIISLMQLPPPRNVEIRSGQLLNQKNGKFDVTPK